MDTFTCPTGTCLTVVFWIHGGGWQTGDKTSVQLKPRVFGARETTHNKLNANLGLPDDPATKELFKFLGPLMGAKR